MAKNTINRASDRRRAKHRQAKAGYSVQDELRFLTAQAALNAPKAIQVWRPQRNSITCMDALDYMRYIPDNSIDMMFIDPPYGHNNNNNGDLIHRRESALGQGKHGKSRAIANDGMEANDLFRAILPEIKRVLKPGSCCCCCCGGGGPDPQFARWSLWLDEVLSFKQMVVWDKGPIGMGWHYRRSYETVLVGMKPGAACAWYDRSMKIENIIRPSMGIGKIIPSMEQHPTEKPVELAEWFIRLHTKPGDVVLDCFAGSGTTLIAAKKLNRQFMGCEIDPYWHRHAEARLRDTDPYQHKTVADGVQQLSLFAEAG